MEKGRIIVPGAGHLKNEKLQIAEAATLSFTHFVKYVPLAHMR
jgi:hypothetical protein